MTDTTEPTPGNEPATPATPAASDGAVIAIHSRADTGFTGRYLHHAPGPGPTVELLRELFHTRYRSRDGIGKAAHELITLHPCGWVRLGTATSRDRAIRPRRAPAPVGECYCHHPDGTARPQLIASALEVLRDVETRGQNWRWNPDGTPGDGTPRKITSGAVPDGIDYAYVFDDRGLTVSVRDGATRDYGRFVPAVTIPWHETPRPDQIQAACDKVRARTPADRAREKGAEILAQTAAELRQIPAHHDLVLHLLAKSTRYLSVPNADTAETALARAAGLHPSELAGPCTAWTDPSRSAYCATPPTTWTRPIIRPPERAPRDRPPTSMVTPNKPAVPPTSTTTERDAPAMLHSTRLAAETDTFHTVALDQWRIHGRTSTTLVYLPEYGAPTLQVLLGSSPPPPDDVARQARDLHADALIVTGEAWVAFAATEKAARLPAADRPSPKESAERYEAIITTAVRADGLTLLRSTRITTGPFGRTVSPESLIDPGQNPDGLAAYLREILTLAARP